MEGREGVRKEKREKGGTKRRSVYVCVRKSLNEN